MADMGSFFNEYGANSPLFWAVVVGVVIGLPVFGYFYNRWIDALGENEHTSLYVVGGVIVVLLAGCLFSLRAAILFAALFMLAGVPMIWGDFQRAKRKPVPAPTQTTEAPVVEPAPRRKRLPYVINGLLDDVSMAAVQAMRCLTDALRKRGNLEEMLVCISLAVQEISTIQIKISEIKNIQNQ
jgi:hypothetical protein